MDAVTTDNVILAGFAAQRTYAGKLKVVGKPFSTEKYGVGLKKGDTETLQQGERGDGEDGRPTDPGRRRSMRTSARQVSRSTPRPTRRSLSPAPRSGSRASADRGRPAAGPGSQPRRVLRC